MLTKFSLCSSVTVGLGKLDGGKLLFCSVGSSLLPRCRCDDNKKNVVLSFVCLIINIFSVALSKLIYETINSMQTTIKVDNLHKRILPDPVEIKPQTSWSPVGHAYDWAIEVGTALLESVAWGEQPKKWFQNQSQKKKISPSWDLNLHPLDPQSDMLRDMEPDSISMTREGTIWGICRICIIKSRY